MDTANLGDSRKGAVAALLRLEKLFDKNAELQTQYTKFLEDYLNLGHMRPICQEDINRSTNKYYLPHHAVLKPSSTSTKLRVVFNGSYRTSSGVSLNDCLQIGPNTYENLATIVSRWRMYPFVYTADIEKMYRQILVHDDDTNFQRIVWRKNPNLPIQDYNLLTVTYGTASAPYLACRTLKQLALDYKDKNPIGTNILLNNFYVDDVLFGAHSMTTAQLAAIELNKLLKCAGFTLRKWSSNQEELLKDIPDSDKEHSSSLQLFSDSQIKTLGIRWHPAYDCFCFEISLSSNHQICTKRVVLSDVSKLFDPLGWLAPVIIVDKIFLQKLWLAKLDWDDILTPDLWNEWNTYKTQLVNLESVRIKRWLGLSNDDHSVEIHGFSDASTYAYAAVVYLRIHNKADNIQVNLVTCKTKVAPLKTLSIPRLELCGASLLTKLVASVHNDMKLESASIYLWTDSTIVLTWIKAQPARWKTFVANRVSDIQTTLPQANWRFVPTQHNPADCATRGLSPTELIEHPLWWHGPTWLSQHSSLWPILQTTDSVEASSEMRPIVINHISHTNKNKQSKSWDLLTRYSSLRRLLKITAWIMTFVDCLKNKSKYSDTHLITYNLENAFNFWVKYVQNIAFADEINHIKNKSPLPRRSKLLSLNPYLDQNLILRVGGRLQHAPLSDFEIHPIILPGDSYFSTLVIEDSHVRTLHGGTQLTLQHIRTKFWILNARNKVRKYIHRCITCIRYSTQHTHQLMGNLPHFRVTPSKPFTHTGIDYAGPVQITAVRRRGAKSFKAYIALFICLVTRAIHLELVSQLSSEAFLAAYRRFISRRGRCSHVYSDNATNFVGANKLLNKDLQKALSENQAHIRQALTNDGVNWHFIPPVAPHVGGIWEAGIKSMKFHLIRVIGATILSIEEITTLLAQVEACLNSRPLHPISDDPEELDILTPGHFLIGSAPLTIPEPSLRETPISLLSRWKLVQAMLEHFWNRWQKEYLHHLQQRRKWQQEQPSFSVGDLVLLKDDHTPPCKWMRARITETHPGPDKLIRVVTLKHKNGYFKRHINKLILLPPPEAN